jgi:RRXRR protein
MRVDMKVELKQVEIVFVQDQHGRPLMPTRRLGQVRRWLASGRAEPVRYAPFTIRLRDADGGYVQPLESGIDLGTAHVGVSVVGGWGEVFAAEFKLRTDLSGLLTDRRSFRRTRRNRQTRHRASRFLNRKHQDELAPSIRARVDETLKVIALVGSILPVTHWILEAGNFDPHQLVNPGVTGEGYQLGVQYGWENTRAYVLWRDHHRCQNPACDHSDPVLTVHHLRQRTNLGSDRPANLVTLCKTCHWRHHHPDGRPGEPFNLKAPETVRDATQFNIVKAYVLRATTHLNRSITYGHITKAKRIAAGLPKTHVHDAFVIAGGARQPRASVNYLGVFFRRQNRKLFKGARSHLRNTIPSAKGFKRGDQVQLADGREGFIYGLRTRGAFDVRKLDGTSLGNSVSYKTLCR